MTRSDFEAFWPTFRDIVTARETYAFDPSMSFEAAYELWCITPLKTFAVELDGEVAGSYYIKPNGMGPADHICNCGYMVGEAARGKGLARRMCEHSQAVAVELGFRAMQFNAVVSTNEAAVALWKKLGFEIVGVIPEAYRHARLGYVDSYIMHKTLAERAVGV